MDIVAYNRKAWSHEVEQGNMWTIPLTAEQVTQARQGRYTLLLTPEKPVPPDWMGEVAGKRVLCLASGGGQQGPIFAALGARVTVFDNCPDQLARDAMVAQRDGLSITLEQGDMADLSRFADGSFDLIFHPVSNCFVPDVEPVWRECFRVLAPGGSLLAGFVNPVNFIFDWERTDDRLEVRYRIPYADTEQLPPKQLAGRIARQEPMEFGHSLDSQIGGQLRAGFLLAGFFEDRSGGQMLDAHLPTFIATRAVKP